MLQSIAKSICVAAFLLAADSTPCLCKGLLPSNFKNPEGVQRIEDGQIKVANAAWWGFDQKDSTRFLQAVDDQALRIVEPAVSRQHKHPEHRQSHAPESPVKGDACQDTEPHDQPHAHIIQRHGPPTFSLCLRG